jgi:hypothetical protein
MLLFAIVAGCFLWMHLAIRRMSRMQAVSTRPFASAAE